VSYRVLTHVNKGDVLCPTNSCAISHFCSESRSKSVASVECGPQYLFSILVTTYLFDTAFKLEAHFLGDRYGHNQSQHVENTDNFLLKPCSLVMWANRATCSFSLLNTSMCEAWADYRQASLSR